MITSPYKTNLMSRGRVRVFHMDADGVFDLRRDVRNTIVYQGADILAKLLTGNPEYAVSGMYIEFENSNPPSGVIAVARADTPESIPSSSANPTDFMRVGLSATPLLASTDDDFYSHNQATFFAITEGSIGFNGVAFTAASNSVVRGAGLVARRDPADQTLDLLYARVALDPLAVPAGGRIAVEWRVFFT